MRRAYYGIVWYFTWPLFVAGAGLFAVICLALCLVPRPAFAASVARRCIRQLFRVFTGWLNLTGLIRIEWVDPDLRNLPHPAVYVANHPGLLDAAVLLSRLGETVCIVKPAVMRNPFLGPAARAAGYVAGDGGVDTLHSLIERLTAGQSVLIFPEGTRTDASAAFNPLKPGFALVARRSARPIQIVLIEASRDLLPRGSVWWRLPRLPARYRIRLDACFAPVAAVSAEAVMAQTQSRFAAGLSPG